ILKTFANRRAHLNSWIYYQTDSQVKPLVIADNWALSFIDSEPAIEDTFSIGSPGSWTTLGHENATVNVGTALYKTTFDLPDGLKESQWLLSLGDVRESARVRINGHDVATLWAVPFEAYVGKYLKEGRNILEVEVTNLPANRIADYCRRNIPWRKFKDANVVSIAYGPVTFETWSVLPSGLLGPVTLIPMERQSLSE
ncbi:MAG: glycosyl hydrolase family 2, partial [Rikenellaceae bacterium]|nr:glycosyl hydrolase family 2 [Rikenellaceae bacterium]